MSAPEYTPAQRLAIERRHGATSVDAGAGCGKTFVLTERFLSHLEPRDGTPATPLDRVVAITFTDAAAREMRARIRARCRERLAAAGPAHARFWRNLLRAVEGARVSTIHSFAAQLVRDNAIALGVDPSFAVLDPADGRVLRGAAIDETLRNRLAPREGSAPEDLIATAAEFDLTGLRDRVAEMVDHADGEAFGRWLRARPEDLVDAWRRYYVERVARDYADQIDRRPVTRELRELLGVATPRGPAFADRVADLAEALDALSSAPDPDAALRRFRDLLDFGGGRQGPRVVGKNDWPDAETSARFTQVCKSLRETLDRQRRAGDPESMRRAAELGLHVQRLAEGAARRYREAKRLRGVLDNDDLLTEAHRLLTAAELAAEREQVRGSIDVLLVDEFQDTDSVQSEIVRAIIGPHEATGDRALFCVGDFKQSIYRFRGAVPRVFQDLRERTPDEGRLTLAENFRSQPAVLDFVNALFNGVFGAAYAPLRATRPQGGPRPAVEFLWTPLPDERGARAERRAEAEAIAARLRELIDAGEPIVGEKGGSARPARPGDFALLFRALGDVAPYEAALRDAGLPYYLVGGHAFYAQQEVFDVLNLVTAIRSECDEIALAGALRSPLFGLTDEGLLALAQRGGLAAGLFAPSLPPDLTEADARVAAHARETLRALRREQDRVGAAELLRRAWDATGYDAALVGEFLGERKLGNLEKLHEQAREADAAGAGLAGLAARLAEFVRTPPKEALASTTALDADVVRLMTVHASKGLEFPIVVVPDLNRKAQEDRSIAVFSPDLGPLVRPVTRLKAEGDERTGPPVGLDFWKAADRRLEQEERQRVFYVAATRAADRLILSACVDPAASPKGPWLETLAENFDLATGAWRAAAPGADPLVAVTPPPPRATRPVEREARRLAVALEGLEGPLLNTAAATPADEGSVTVRAADLVTMSVSRLTGQFVRESPTLGSDPLEAAEGVDPRRLGNLVHAVIERLDPGDPDPASSIARWANALAPRELRREARRGAELAIRLVGRLVASPLWDEMRAAPRLLREVEFLLRWPPSGHAGPPAVIRGYIDALFEDANGAWRLVDFKTNSVEAAGVPALAERYALQLATYAHAVEAAYGVQPASLRLAFLAAGVTHELAWDDAAGSASATAITGAIAEARRSAAEETS